MGLAALIALVAGTPAAFAALPEIADRVPGNAQVVITLSNMDAFITQVESMGKLFGSGDQGPMKELDELRNAKGIKKDGSVAIAVMPTADGEPADSETPNMLVFVPVTDYKAFVAGFDGDATQDVSTLNMKGEDGFSRDIGNGYALLSPIKELVQAYEASKGQREVLMARAGARGRDIIERSDMVIIADVQSMKPMLEKGLNEIPNPADLMGGMGGGGGGGDEANAQIAEMKKIGENFIRDGSAGIVGVNLSGGNVVINLGAQFTKGSELAGFFAGSGNSGALLNKLPATPFLMAIAMDMTSPGIRTILTNLQKLGAAEGQEGSQLSKMLFGGGEGIEGTATVIGFNPMALMGGGLFINSTQYTATKDPAGTQAKVKAAMESMNGLETKEGSFATKYEVGVVEVSGVKADKSTMKITPGADSDPMMGQAMAMMLGPTQELTMLSAAVEGGIVTTMSNNPPLLSSALEAAKSGKGLGGDEAITVTRSLMPANRVFEGYLGTKALLDSVGPFLAMIGGPEELPVPATLAPVGMAMTSGDEGMSFSIVIPADNMKAFAEIAKAMEGMNGGGDAEPADAPDEEPAAPAF